MHTFAGPRGRDQGDGPPFGGRADALLWLTLGAATAVVGWIAGHLFMVMLGLVLVLPGLLMLVLDRFEGGHPAPDVPAEEQDDGDVDEPDAEDEPVAGHAAVADPYDDGGPLPDYGSSRDAGTQAAGRGATRIGGDDDPTEVYQPRRR